MKLQYLSTRVQPLPDDQVDHEPGQQQCPHQLPLQCAKTLLDAFVLVQNAEPVTNTVFKSEHERLRECSHPVFLDWRPCGVVLVLGVVGEDGGVRGHVVGRVEAELGVPPAAWKGV